MDDILHSVRRCIKQRGLRLTLPRRIIIEALRSARGHMSADEIYITLHKKYPRIDFTTVYRTLDLLVQLEVVDKFDFGDGKSRYELRNNKTHHHHLVCRSCGKVVDCDECVREETRLIQKIEERLSSKYTFSIDNHHLHFYGLCTECDRKNQRG